MREVIKTGASIEEAIDRALAELGLDRDRVSYEVIDVPEKRFFFKKPAKVRVWENREEFSVKDLLSGAGDKKPAKEEKRPGPRAKPERSVKPEKTRKPAERAERVEKPEAENGETGEKTERAEKPRYAPEKESRDTRARQAIEFLKGVVERFGIENCEYRAVEREGGFEIKIEGENLGSLIGRKGEVMEALSSLVGIAVNRGEEAYVKVSVDVGNYRRKREKDIENIARRAAIRVAKTGRSFSLDPMNPYERRIVHAAVSKVEGVRSESKGEGASRRVIIYSLNPAPRDDRRFSGDRNGSDRRFSGERGERGRYNDRRPRSSRDSKPAQVQKTREEKFTDSPDLGLYSKIELD